MQTKMLARRLGALAVLGAWLAASPRLEADPPQGHETTFRLSGASAPPGGEAKVTFSIASNRSTQAFLFSIDFDEELLEAGSEMERIFQSPNGEPWGFALYYADNSNAVPGNAGVDEGYVVGAAVFSLNEDIHLPVGTETEVAAISLRVKPGAPIGSTQLRFVDGARVPDWDNPAENLVTLDQNGELPTGTQVSPLLIESNFRILPD